MRAQNQPVGRSLPRRPDTSPAKADAVNHPKHYNQHPSGVECITIVEPMGFNVGNAIKYLWRAGLKGDEIEDLKKAAWYVEREIQRRTGKHMNLPRPCGPRIPWSTSDTSDTPGIILVIVVAAIIASLWWLCTP